MNKKFKKSTKIALIILAGGLFILSLALLLAADKNTDSNDEDMLPQEGSVKYQFSYTNEIGETKQFVDESKSCDLRGPTTALADINGDNVEEIIVECTAGSRGVASYIYFYELNNNKIEQIASLFSDDGYKTEDRNADGVLDLVVYNDDNLVCENKKDCSNEEYKSREEIYSWDEQTNEFIESKIGEE